ncbi:MAG: putative methyl-accepting chemotaxis protein [Paenibacillus sp.]|jgi:methyl-accepting chemotaxis protein|nr:putative methyl-accepting chemotaxis protein [Paenibacillus sp.]
MVVVHLLFVIFFIGAVTYQIVARKRIIHNMEQDQEAMLKLTIRQVITSISETSNQMLKQSKVLSDNSNQLNVFANEIVTVMCQMDTEARTQETGTESNMQMIREFVHNIRNVAEISADASASSGEAAGAAKKGNESIQFAVNQIQSVNHAAQDVATKVKLLNERSGEIDGIIGILTDLSSQTNLLALNASIEAARAGEHGSGFAVVAGEVRKLSVQSSQSSARIAELIQEMTNDARASSTAMDSLLHEVDQGKNAVMAAGDEFENILNKVQTAAGQMEYISAASRQMSVGTEQMTASMNDIIELTKKVNSSVKYVTESSSQQQQLISTTSQLAGTLEEQSSTLNQIIAKTRSGFSLS